MSLLIRKSVLLVAFLVFGCAAHVEQVSWVEPRSQGTYAQGQASPRLQLAGVAEPSSGRIGWIYRIEGKLNGQPVQYVGSAAHLKKRLTNEHEWAALLRQDSTKVYAMEVFAELDVRSSNRQSLLSARNEALRAAEQRVLEQTREQVDRANRKRGPGEKRTRILNKDNAAADPATWEARHKVRTSQKWRPFERSGVSAATKALAILSIFDAYLMYYDAKMSHYVMAPYVLEDEAGVFTLDKRTSRLASHYYKTYIGGQAVGRTYRISADEFSHLKEEAEALWGTTDWRGEFVPGLLNRTLPVIYERGGI